MQPFALGLVPVMADPGTMLALHEVTEELGSILGGAVNLVCAPSPEALEREFASGRANIIWSSPVLALSSPRLRSAVPVVCSVREGNAYYHSVLIVRQSSPISSPLELRGTRAVWVARTSASGYLFPRIALAGHGIDPTSLFAHEEFLGAHGAVVEAVQAGRADVGATFAVFEGGDATRPLVRAGHHDDKSHGEPLRVLLATPRIPSDLFVVSRPLFDTHGPILVAALEALGTRVPHALQTAFGTASLVRTGERELGDLRGQLVDAAAMGLFDSA